MCVLLLLSFVHIRQLSSCPFVFFCFLYCILFPYEPLSFYRSFTIVLIQRLYCVYSPVGARGDFPISLHPGHCVVRRISTSSCSFYHHWESVTLVWRSLVADLGIVVVVGVFTIYFPGRTIVGQIKKEVFPAAVALFGTESVQTVREPPYCWSINIVTVNTIAEWWPLPNVRFIFCPFASSSFVTLLSAVHQFRNDGVLPSFLRSAFYDSGQE